MVEGQVVFNEPKGNTHFVFQADMWFQNGLAEPQK